jgi:HD-GYP domain-containing protein (c-di-GMP phosphodiesterase class II)
MMLTLGNNAMDDLPDVGAAGLIHDLALRQAPISLVEKHLIGDEDLTTGEKLVYMRHTDMILDVIKKNKIPMTPGSTRAIQLHHENWDGSGFRGMSANSIYRPARILRVADEVVSCLNHPTRRIGITESLSYLAQKRGRGDAPLYDPEILATLIKSLV